MNRTLASSLAFTGTAAAALAFAALSTVAHADDITVDPTPFVSSKTRAEVRGEVLGQSDAIRMAHAEGAPHANGNGAMRSALTRAQVRDDYLAARAQVSAFGGEDSGSAYITAMQPRRNGGVTLAEAQR